MKTGATDSGYFDAEAFQAGPFVHAGDVQRDRTKRLVRSQRASWRTVVSLTLSVALIFLVVKCTMLLSLNKGTSVRMLAERGRGKGSGLWRPLVHHASDSEGDESCSTASGQRSSSRRGPKKRHWWEFWKQNRPEPEMTLLGGNTSPVEEPSPGPSMAFAGSDGIDNPGSSTHPRRPRVQHTTEVSIGDISSPHYGNLKKPYEFPRLGTGKRFDPTRRILKKAQEVASALCFLHRGPYSSYVRSDYTPSTGGSPANVYILISEAEFGDKSGFSQLKRAFTSGGALTHRHFGRDVALVVEEMILLVLSEVEETGVPGCETTRLFFEFVKPDAVPSSGKVVFEVFATSGRLYGLAQDERTR